MARLPDDDEPIGRAAAQVSAACGERGGLPQVQGFFDEATFTVSYVVSDPDTRRAAIIDSVWDYDPAAARTSHRSADALIEHVRAHRLEVDWILETHAHADHLSAAAYLQEKLGGRTAISRHIVAVQRAFGEIFNEGDDFARDGSQFDRLLADGDELALGDIPLIALHVPGHTPADMAFVIGDALFAGDTIFMPDYGSARADFPGGDSHQLYRSVRRLMALPDETRVFLCHDYKAPGRDQYAWECTLGAQRTGNVHIRDGIDEEAFAEMRDARDATLPVPKLLLPAMQVNLRGGRLPPPAANGISYLKLPVNRL